MELLLESKANTSDQAYTGLSRSLPPSAITSPPGFRDLFSWPGAVSHGEIIRASALEDPEHLRLLLQCKVDPNVADYDRRCPDLAFERAA
eukprot:873297-Rhodomonas_salina.1